jgi:selenocysteine-specific elongation factor
MSSADAPLTLGTAGHIDHGKTALIGALTGRQTDRLPEERERGISIDLGYAPLELPSGRRLSVVDVPGHERFVRTMVAGASGIDLFLLCVAADDGVMAQTREHLAVLRQLEVTDGVVAITKGDAADPGRAAAELDALVPGVPRVAVSARTGAGLDELLALLDAAAARVEPRSGDEREPRLHVDRSFSLHGIGTVVTGTLWSGSIARGDRVVVLPRGLDARVRSVEVHDQQVDAAAAGQRVALNLAGVGRDEVARGDVITVPGGELAPTWLVDARIELEDGVRLERGARLHVHHGTREAPARVMPIEGSDLVQLRLESQLVPAAGDRLVLRQVAPPDTIGGGEVVDPLPRKRSRVEEPGPPAPADAATGDFRPDRDRKSPTDEPELDRRALQIASLLDSDGFEPRADGELAAVAGIEPREAARLWSALERAGRAVRVAKNLHYAPEPLAELERRVVDLCERDGATTIATVRDELGTSRRYAQAVLEHLDATKVTLRRGDEHVLRRGAP